jgi:hypothetical protein
MNSQLYLKECLQKRILPLIRSHQGPVMFWPDLASCHYARVTMDWYQSNEVDILPKEMNPPNCPQFRPIEKYWAIVKGKLLKNGGSATEVNKMRQKWNKFAGEVTPELVQKMMRDIKRKVRNFLRSDED